MSVKEKISAECIAVYEEFVKQKRKQRKKGSTGMLIFFVVCMLFGGLVGFFGAMYLDKASIELKKIMPFPEKDGLEILYLLAVFLFFLVTMVLHTIIHEGGHLIFGLLTGYGFLSFRVFSLTIVKKDGKLIRKKLKVPGTMGQCLMTPPEWKEDGRYPYVWYNLGGGFMNLISCLLVLPLFLLNSPLLAWAVGVFLFVGVVFVCSNLLPMTIGIPNDGKNCLLCRKARENQKAFYLQLKLNAMLTGGAVFEELPEEMFDAGEHGRLNALTCYIRLQAFYRYLQKKEEDKAEECLASMEQEMEKLPMGFMNAIDMERMFLMLQEKAPVEQIAAHYAVLQPAFAQGKDISVLRVKYAYYLLLNDEERETIEWLVRSKNRKLPKKLPKRKPVSAETVFEDMEKAAAKHPVAGEAELFMSLAAACREKAEKAEI
ncbi:MAG: hypothetical protein PUC73_04625 [Lachnospiraceae bacterium]|nr:hypothetical protein [Lachnospiraceae bacterium]